MTAAATFNRRAIEDALFTWFAGATGLNDRVHWEGQDGAAPVYPHGTIKMGAIRGIGRDEQRINGEPANPTDGREVAIESRGQRECVVSLNVYSVPPNGDNANEPEDSAHAIMDRARSSLEQSDYLDPLCAAGVSFLRAADQQNLDGLIVDAKAKRAQLDVTFSIASNAESRVGYIARVELSTDLEGTDTEFPDLILPVVSP